MKNEGSSQNNLFTAKTSSAKTSSHLPFLAPQSPCHSTPIGLLIPLSLHYSFQPYWTHHSNLIGLSISPSPSSLLSTPKLPDAERAKQKNLHLATTPSFCKVEIAN